MSEYIDKWYVVNRLIDLENKFQRLKPFHGNEQDMYEKICELEIFLGKSPAADVVPVVHGVWEPIIDDFGCLEGWIHPECGRTTKEATAHCPNCGAKMDLEEEQ